MFNPLGIFRHHHAQALVFGAVSLSMLFLAGILYFIDHEAYSGFFGRINPVLVMIVVIIAGSLLIARLLSTAGLKVYNDAPDTGRRFIFAMPVVLFIGIAWVDSRGVFPQDLNVVFPDSLLFYPSIAYVVEIIFHVLPLALCVFLISAVFKQRDQATVLFISIPLVALLEPIFQILTFGRDYPAWAIVYVVVNILVINLLQLWLFVKYDFVSMMAFRLIYYLLWHIIWGALRLRWLF